MQLRRGVVVAWGLVCWASPLMVAQLAQRTEQGASAAHAPAQRRTRLILKNGSYQVVMSYTITAATVRFVSAERAGETEEIPLALVDLDATKKWERQHAPDAVGDSRPAPALDPELLKEEADRAALTPEVAPDLRLAPEDSVLALDTYRSGPELIPLMQSDGELNKQTGHNILRSAINPLASSHQIVVLKGEKAAVQMHVNDPVFYLKLDEETPASGEALTVDTHGASGEKSSGKKSAPANDYVIVRVDVRQNARVVASFNTSALGTTKRQEDVVETVATTMPGGHWMKIVPREPLLMGEYALMEVLGEKAINLGVWDFGVHPTAPENRDALKPEKRRPAVTLERRSKP
jgi:hypothetical protein